MPPSSRALATAACVSATSKYGSQYASRSPGSSARGTTPPNMASSLSPAGWNVVYAPPAKSTA